MASIERRPDGKYRARYRGLDRKERSRHFERKSDAQRWLTEMTSAVDQRRWTDPALARITVEGWSARWFAAQVQLKPSTRNRYGGLLRNQVLPAWQHVPLDRVAYSDVSSWVASLSASGLSPSSVRQSHRVLSLVLQHAVRDGRITRNPAEGVPLPRPTKPQPRYLTREEVERLAQCAEQLGADGDVIRFLALTGLRFGEAAALRVGKVDLQRRRVAVVQAVTEVNGELVWGLPKNHQVRSVPIAKSLVEPLSRLCSGRGPDELVFTSRRGEGLRINNWSKRVFARAARAAGLRDLIPHDLRDTAASLAVAAGGNVKAVQRMVGHASAAMTLDVYAGLFEDDLDALADRLDGDYVIGSLDRPVSPTTANQSSHVKSLR